MARQRAWVVTEPTRPPFRDALARAWYPRLSEYGRNCIRLARLAADLPPDLVRMKGGSRSARLGDLTRPQMHVLMRWVCAVLEENVLAGAVLTDALDFTFGMLGGDRGREFPEAVHKRELTMAAGDYWIEFTVPPGWEFVLDGTAQPVGFTGVAMVKRCHLSESIYPDNSGHGRLIGAPGSEADLGFEIPCGYFRGYQIEGNRLVHPPAPPGGTHYGVGVCVPYAFVRRAFYLDYVTGEEITEFVPRPTDDEIDALARAAVTQQVSAWESGQSAGDGAAG